MPPVERKLSIRMRGEAVKVLHDGLERLGYRIPSAEKGKKYFGSGTRSAVMKFQKKHNLKASGEVDKATAATISQASEAKKRRRDSSVTEQFVVRGLVCYPDGKPLVGSLVRAFDKDLRSEELLGEATTDRRGRYEIHYGPERFRRAEKKSADLVVRAYNSNGAELAASPVLFNAGNEETIDLVVGGETYRGPSEYAQLIETLKPVLQDLSPADLTLDDISFLVSETSQDRDRIVHLSTAHRLGGQTNLPPEAFYGLFRENLPTDLPALLAITSDALRKALETALRDNIIPATLEAEINEIVRRMQVLQVDQPVFLVKPAVLFGPLTNLRDLTTEQATFINARLNEHLCREILSALGTVSKAMNTVLQSTLAQLDYQEFRDTNLSDLIRDGIITKIKRDPKLADEATNLETRVFARRSASIADLLHLDVALRDNPIFGDDLRRAKTVECARLAGLDDRATRKLLEKSSLLNEAALAELADEGSLTGEQKGELQFTLELAKLTGDNFPFVGMLKTRDTKSVMDLVSWEKKDWLRLISDEGLALPQGETPETYAESIMLNVEQTYPSQVLLKRLAGRKQFPQISLLDLLSPLLRNNDRLIDGSKPASLDWRGVSSSRRVNIGQALQDLTAFANTYRYIGVGDLINDKALELEQKKSAIASRLQILSTFYHDNPQVDLRLINFFDTGNRGLNWSNIPVAWRPQVRKQLMAYQRVLNLGIGVAEQQMLLSKGYDSALSIAARTEKEFVNTSDLSLGEARFVYKKAQEHALSVSHYFETIRHAVKGAFKNIPVSNIDPKLINDLQAIDGFEDLFGFQDYCDCEECRSILSPAAYFVDLMYFIEQHISKPIFIDANRTSHSLYLKNRRADLWTLQLTCENTNTEIPYLTIVNEVLEIYLNKIVAGNVYETLADKNENISFGLPFNLPLEQIRLYLSHFGLTLTDVYRVFKQSEAKIWRARLNLSKEEYEIIISPDPAGVVFRFGNLASLVDFPVNDYKNTNLGIDRRGFINFAGITRQQLGELLNIRFNPDLKNIQVANMVKPDELQNFPEVLKNLTNDRMDFIHRFVRLWRRTSWSIPDLDMVLCALKEAGLAGQGINPDAVLSLAQLVDLQNRLGLTVEELCVIVNQLPISKDYPKPVTKQSDQRLYERLFDLKKLFGIGPNGQFNTSVPFHHYSLNTANPNDQRIDPNTPLLLAGLGISETELLLLFNLLKDEMPFDVNGDTTLDRRKISLLYRHSRLAKALKLNIEDFIEALYLNFLPPDKPVVTTLTQIQQLKAFTKWLKTSPFSVSELCFLLMGEESATVKYKITSETIGKVVHDIQKSNEPKKLEAFRTQLSRLFNLSAKMLENTLQWVGTDINSAGIQTALNATFANDATDNPDNPADLNTLLNLTRQMERVLLMFSNLKFKEETVAYLSATPGALGIADLKHLTLENLKALTFFNKLITIKEEAESTVQSVLNSYLAAHKFSSVDTSCFADLSQQEKSLFETLINTLVFSPVPIVAWEYLWECQQVCQTLGINGYSLRNLAQDYDFGELTTAQDIVIGAFSSKYDDEKVRREKLEPYLDRINVIKRDALCDYIIARQQELKFKDRNDIFAFFLLDVEMSGCFRTSRVVCGISSLQLYIDRILTNLEQSASDNLVVLDGVNDLEEFKLEWEWRKNYRVWEANRKVFLYPENYIEPDLRDNKTPIFKELEDELLQQKITKESVQDAYRKYLSQFAELAQLRIAGSYYHVESDTYYFFGCTQQDPPQYFYRRWIGTKEWSPWVKIELGINAERVSAIVHLGRLYLFWVDLKSQKKSQISNGNQEETGHTYLINVLHSYLDEKGKWLPAQKLEYDNLPSDDLVIDQAMPTILCYLRRTCFPKVYSDDIHLFYYTHYSKEAHWEGYMFSWGQVPGNEEYSLRKYLAEKLNFNWVWAADITKTKYSNFNSEQIVISENQNKIDFTLDTKTNTVKFFDWNNWHLEELTVYIENGRLNVYREKPYLEIKAATSETHSKKLDLFNNRFMPSGWGNIPPIELCMPYGTPIVSIAEDNDALYLASSLTDLYELDAQLDYKLDKVVLCREMELQDSSPIKWEFQVSSPLKPLRRLTNNFTFQEFLPKLTSVGYRPGDLVLKLGDQQYLVHCLDAQNFLIADGADWKPGAFGQFERKMYRLSTSLAGELGETLLSKGLEAFLALESQRQPEHPIGINFTSPSELSGPLDDPDHIDFRGAYGTYYRELFFDTPFLIANHLNANQKFEEAKWWYERIFDPTGSKSTDDKMPTDRNWRYIEFRGLTVQKMRDILTDPVAIEQYKKDPFNPHAIARLRLNAYQKAIVMKYIDNLLDWGDYLFGLDTRESINEATMLYVLAADILGKRPVKLGKCQTAEDEDLTYEKIGPNIPIDPIKGGSSEFLIFLENWSTASTGIGVAQNKTYSMLPHSAITKGKAVYGGVLDKLATGSAVKVYPAIWMVLQSTPVFCVPPNDDLLKYWDRVENRLFNIRNCMNISGVRRQLALFQPPINPMLLVRAKAAGLSLEEVLAMVETLLPPYRFSYVIEKAKQFTQTVQSFGSALLSALEKKDVEELTLLRSVHERNILRMTEDIKKQQAKEAQYQHQALVETKTNVQNRIDYYQGLIDAGLTGWEVTQQVSKHIATLFKIDESGWRLAANIAFLIPQTGSPFAMTYGGQQLGNSLNAIAGFSNSLSSIAEAVSASAASEASFQRREQEWNHQLLLAQQELKQVEQQRLAAEVRQLIAEKDLEVHEKNMEQADELDEFYKNKFTNLGLYNYLSTTLNRLHREAYNVAYALARMAERAYQFERDDNTIFVTGDNWQFDRAGLLAGERLLLQLQRMEKAYLEQNKRDYEITQSFSLAILKPSELINLRETGSCDFEIPEIMFDLFYPGQYKRIIKSVRLTLPCVTGPYTNVSAMLTLKGSKVRKAQTTDPNDLIDVANQMLTSVAIATSNAQNDGGLFDLSFRDERYLPFEGAGAISTWSLELPSQIRLFDYDTISDVIIHINYTAKDDGALKKKVEDQIVTTLTDFASATGLYRIFSLCHELPNAFYKLLNPAPNATQTTDFDVTKQHFPYFLKDLSLTLTDVYAYLKPRGTDPINTTALTLQINGFKFTGPWDILQNTNLKQGKFSLYGDPIKTWTINAGIGGLKKEELEDFIILLKYKISA